MANFLTKAAGRFIGGAGRAIDIIGKATGNIGGERKVSENLERIGGMLNPRAFAAEKKPPTTKTLDTSSPEYRARLAASQQEQARLREFDAANAARQPTGQTTTTREEPRQEEPRQDQGQGQQEQGESDYDAQIRLAREKQEEADRVAQERVRRYGEVIKPIEGDIESYLSSRPDLKGLFEQELEKQGVSGTRARLGGFEKDVTNLQGQLETIPTEDIQRRKETGMLTAAAERRIRSMEERPIREQLLKTQGAVSSERVGLDRAYQLVDKMLDMQREQEKRGLEPITSKLESARGEFTNEVDALATRLTGFNQARTDQLAVLKQKVANDQALTLQEQKAADDLQKQERAHVLEMERIIARKNNKPFSDLQTDEKYAALQVRIQEGATSQELADEFQNLFEVPTWEKILEMNNNALSLNDAGERTL